MSRKSLRRWFPSVAVCVAVVVVAATYRYAKASQPGDGDSRVVAAGRLCIVHSQDFAIGETRTMTASVVLEEPGLRLRFLVADGQVEKLKTGLGKIVRIEHTESGGMPGKLVSVEVVE